MEDKLYRGLRNLVEYNVGDKVKWNAQKWSRPVNVESNSLSAFADTFFYES